MAKQVLLDATVFINSVDRTDDIAKVEFDDQFEEKETTTYGSGGAKEVIAGLESGSVGLTFKNNYSAGALDSAMWALRRQVVPITFRPNAAVVSSSNPQYSCDILINSWKPISGSVGDVAEVDVTFPMSGPMSRTTAT